MNRLIITEGEKNEILSLYNLGEESSIPKYTGFTDYPGDDWEFEKPSHSSFINYPDNWLLMSTQEKLVFVAKQMAEKKIDVSRQAKGTKETIWKNITGQEEFKTNTCVKGVCEIYKNAGLSSGIPTDVLDNRTFKQNHAQYGYKIVPNKELKPGDLIQYVRPSENMYPYHIGIYVGNNEYVSDGSADKPIMKQNIYKKDNGENKDPFIVYRKL